MTASFELSFAGGPMEALYRCQFEEAEDIFADSPPFTPESQRAADQWLASAHNEHHSAALMAQLSQLLTLAQAPLDLTAVACGFLAQELSHAELCARLALHLSPRPELRAPPLALVTFADALSARQRADEAIIVLCCIGESFSFDWLKEMRRHAAHPAARYVVGRLLKDEALHAQFGWHYLSWAKDDWSNDERARLAAVCETVIASYASVLAGKQTDNGALAFGILDSQRQARVARATVAKIQTRFDELGLHFTRAGSALSR